MMKTLALILGILAFASGEGAAPESQMKVDGKTMKLTQAYAYSTEGFFDKKKNDTVVILADRALTEAQVRDGITLRRMASDGKLNFVQGTIDASGQVVNFLIGSQAFKALPSGGSTEHVFEGKLDGRTISGKLHTKGEQQFFGTKYEYNAAFQTTVQAKK
jgi:hypothetical protein